MTALYGNMLKIYIIQRDSLMRRLFIQLAGFLFILFLLPSLTTAESARGLVEEGNKTFAGGDYAASLEQYNKAAEIDPDSAIILFNKGDALYKQGKFAEALNAFDQAAAKAMQSNDRTFEAQSRYNMGNSSFQKGEKLKQKDLETALAEYKRSSEYFQSAVKLNPDFTDAAHNLEASRIVAKQVEELIRLQKQEARQQEQQKQEIAEELENLQKEQQGAAEQSKDLDQSGQQEEAKHEGVEQAQQLAENQKSITDRTREAGKKLDELGQSQNTQPGNEKAREHVNKAVEKQEEAEKKLEQNKLSEAHEDQQEASRELQKALERLEQENDREQGNDEPGRQGQEIDNKKETEQQKQSEQQTAAEEAGQQIDEITPPDSESYGEVNPEDIITEELENKKYRTVRGKAAYEPVEKDW